jgi:hypothetical protein
MAKYDPLRDYLLRQRLQEIILTFREVESILGDRLPAYASKPQWWANIANPKHGRVQREAWRAAGYDAFLLPPSKVKFCKVA